jgi:thiamine pyrophosphokinase
MERCVIVGGADISGYEYIKRQIRDDDFFIFCDGGLKHMEKIGRKPGLIVGDFDSHEDPHMDVETITLPCEKDDTDTYFAVKEAIKRGYEEFMLIGVVGNRFDHTMGNISILLYLDSHGKKGVIIDDYSEMQIVSDNPVYIDDSYSYFSLLNISGTAKGIDITGAKYPLENGEITPEYQYGISNEVLPGKAAGVSVKEGRLLLVKVF